MDANKNEGECCKNQEHKKSLEEKRLKRSVEGRTGLREVFLVTQTLSLFACRRQ